MIMHSMKSMCFAFLILSFFVSSSYSVPPVINYAGQVAVDGEAFDGEGFFKFAIVNDSGSTTYWSNDGTSNAGSEPTASVSVSVSGGLYSVLLGNSSIQGMNAIDSAVFQQNADAKLRVWFNDGTNGFQQLTPDRPFASVPYAMSSGNAGTVDIAPGSIDGSMLSPSLLADLNSSITDGSISKAKMDPNLVRYFVPEISTNPAAVSIIQGTDTTLSVQAEGRFLSYQWQKNGANLAGQTTPSLVLINANASEDDANYSVVISNDWGSVTSPLARVTVATALPTITLNGAASITHEAATLYTEPGATAVDAFGGDLTSSISITSADINVTEVGNQAVTYSVADAGGNTNTATRTVTVQDTTAPTLTLIGDSNFTHNLNSAWVDPGYDANDTLDGNLTASVSISGTVDVNTTGTYTLNYSVSDTAGNLVDINRTVTVIETPQGPWIFTNAGATGRFGPTQAQINTSYSGTSLEGSVTINSTHQGIQEWTVPASGTYRVEAFGAEGGAGSAQSGGAGAKVIGEFNLSKSEEINILIGQKGNDGGGGGGTYVTKSPHNTSSSILLVAGGGGGGSGACCGNPQAGGSGLISTSGGSGINFSTNSNAVGGTLGNGGEASDSSGGAGFFTNGRDTKSFINGGSGSEIIPSYGGFGGGASRSSGAGGGGGGYSGGGGSGGGGQWGAGGGGGSYNSGTNQDNQAGANQGQGKVIITYIGN